MRTEKAYRLITGDTGRRVHAALMGADSSLCNAVPNKGEVDQDFFRTGADQVTCQHCQRILWLRRINQLDRAEATR